MQKQLIKTKLRKIYEEANKVDSLLSEDTLSNDMIRDAADNIRCEVAWIENYLNDLVITNNK